MKRSQAAAHPRSARPEARPAAKGRRASHPPKSPRHRIKENFEGFRKQAEKREKPVKRALLLVRDQLRHIVGAAVRDDFLHLVGVGNVRERIAIDHDHVGELAGLDRAAVVIERLRRIHRAAFSASNADIPAIVYAISSP